MSQPSAQGIASLYRGNPAPLQQRIQQEQQAKPGLPQDLQKLMALNIVTNEKDAMAKQQAMSQLAQMQGPQGKPPTVMESVQEQARQKMQAQAMQAQRQQQAMQAMAQQAGPGPVPEGTQFAQAQPTAQGIDDLPVEFGLAGGGIVAFQEGKKVPRIQDEVPISEEERERLQQELLMRIIGEEARNPPAPKRPPMEITESDLSSIPGMEPSDLMARALREASGPQPDNRAMLNAAEASAARKNAMADREREKAANRPKYETSYDRMNRKNRGEMTEEERQAQAARDSLISQIPTGGEPTVTGGERVSGSETERNIRNTLSALPGAGASKATTLGRQSLAGLAALFGMDKSNSPATEKASTPAATPEPTPVAKMQEQTYRRVSGDSGARPPAAGLKALAEADARKQQAARPPAPVAQAAAPAAPVAPASSITPPISELQAEAQALNVESMRADPQAAAANKEIMYGSRVGPYDATQRDAMIKQLQEERARHVGPQDSFGRLMEYLGQIAATPRGMSSFEAGAAGARGVRGLEEQRAQKRFDLGSKIIEQEQGKIDGARAYAKELYGVGEKEFDQIVKQKYEAIKSIDTSETEKRKMAQQEALKVLELQQQATLERERMKNNLAVANINQTRENNEQARNQQYLNLSERARKLREAGDTAGADRVQAQANDILTLKGGTGTAGVGAGRNKIMERRQSMTELEKIIKDEGMVYSEADKASAAREYRRLAMLNVQEGEGGGSSAFTVTAGGKTYTFPTQEAANKFKAEAGVK
jgi:hypothetical protein